ncbi:YhdP family protein [Chitinasiproducens palmae]|uniref:TIGR02099 family protein n=1 Tax=Chitinasiproducens palmae TaxID=1770053 RepID=A0A1H2PRD0_9BURK|nr:YhdP family protein [Chitinasiproducens palmae]SDV49468.1 TIGR02099 family protein [Chitinasiproducens palmae]
MPDRPARQPSQRRVNGETALRAVLRGLLIAAALLYFLVGVGMAAINWLVMPNLDALKPRVEAVASRTLGARVRIDQLSARWRALSPEVEVAGLTIDDRQGRPGLSVPGLRGVIAWRSLWHLRPIFALIEVSHPRVNIRRDADGSITAAGVPVPTHGGHDDVFGNWLLRQESVIVHDGSLVWRDALHAAPPLTLSNAKLALYNRGHLHRLGMQASAGPLAERIDLRAAFRHGLFARPAQWHSWIGEAYLDSSPLALVAAARYIDLPMPASRGTLAQTVWLRFANGRPTRLEGALSGRDLLLGVPGQHATVDAPRLDTRFRLRLNDDFFAATLERLRIEVADQPPLADATPINRVVTLRRLDGRYRASVAGSGERISLRGDFVDIGLISDFVRALPLPKRVAANLDRLRPRGLLHDFDLLAERASVATPDEASAARATGDVPLARFRIKARMEGASLAAGAQPPGLTAAGHPRVGVPGFDNLSGSIDANERGGHANLDSRDASITISGLFDLPTVHFDRLAGTVNWKASGATPQSTYDARVARLDFQNGDARGSLSGNWRGAPAEPRHSVLDLRTRFDELDVAQVARYLPTSVAPGLRAYLGHALVSGVSRGATIEVHGPLDEFPYREKPATGTFTIDAPFADGRFDPSPHPPVRLPNGEIQRWPTFEAVHGRMRLADDRLDIDVSEARYRGIRLGPVRAGIPALGDPRPPLTVEGKARGPLADLLAYVESSPLGVWSHHVAANWRADGAAALNLRLTIPRQHTPQTAHKIGVAGAIDFNDGRLAVPGLPALSAIRGRAGFTDTQLTLAGTQARLLGGELRASGTLSTVNGYDVTVNGALNADQTRPLLSDGPFARLSRRFTGNAPYTLTMKGKAGETPDVTLRSDLSGMAIDLPAPLRKPAGSPLPLLATFRPTPSTGGGALARGELSLGVVNAAALFRVGAPRGTSALLAAGVGIDRPAPQPTTGFAVVGQAAALDGDAWRTVVSEIGTPASSATGATGATVAADGAPLPLPDRVSLNIGQLTLFSRRFDRVSLDAQRSDQAWQAKLDSAQIAGTLRYLPATPKVVARLTRLRIPSASVPAAEAAAPTQGTAATRYPAVDLIADDFVVGQRDFGRLQLTAHNVVANGRPSWLLDQLVIENAAARLKAHGEWQMGRHDGPGHTTAEVGLDIVDAGALLDRFGLPRTLKGGAGSLAGNIDWAGDPGAIDYASLRGALALKLANGQILKVDPGAARLLGVLSLQGLARLATLDFKGLFGEGLPFNLVSATGTIQDGIARTDDFRIDAPVATVSMHGQVDLPGERQDLRVKVVPHVNAGSASLAAAFVNPLLGLGTLAAQLLLSPALSHTLTRYYQIDGTWAAPNVVRLPEPGSD